jgi:hypothetical protein
MRCDLEFFRRGLRLARRGFTLFFVGIAASLAADQAVAEPTNTIRGLVQALTRCWRAPPGSDGSELTVGLMLTRTGDLFGKPQITYSKLMGDPPARRRFVNSVLMSLASCLPVEMTETLGQAIAGRRLTIRFTSKPRERGAALEVLMDSASMAWVQRGVSRQCLDS